MLVNPNRYSDLINCLSEGEKRDLLTVLESINKGEIPSISWLSEEAKEILFEVLDSERERLEDTKEKVSKLKRGSAHLAQKIGCIEALIDCLEEEVGHFILDL